MRAISAPPRPHIVDSKLSGASGKYLAGTELAALEKIMPSGKQRPAAINDLLKGKVVDALPARVLSAAIAKRSTAKASAATKHLDVQRRQQQQEAADAIIAGLSAAAERYRVSGEFTKI